MSEVGELPAHSLKVAILQPQIAPNTGNIARLCVATGTPLHLVRPMGFVLSDQKLKRSAMDYWPRLKLTLHDDTESFLVAAGGSPRWFFSTKGNLPLWDANLQDGDWLIFGSETNGIDREILDAHPDHTVRIPQAPGERCLNLSTAVGAALYERSERFAAGRHLEVSHGEPYYSLTNDAKVSRVFRPITSLQSTSSRPRGKSKDGREEVRKTRQ